MQKGRILKWIPLVALLLLVASLFSLTASAATTLTLLDGDLTITDSVGTGTESSGTVTITAKGSFLSKKTNTVTLVNETNSTATLSFDYTVSNADSHTLPANSGTYSAILDAGASTSFTITSKALNGTVTLKISNLSLVEAQSSSSITFAYDDSLGSVTVDGSAVSNGSTASIPLSGAELNATAKAGSTFLGWIDGDNKWLSTAASYTLTPTEDMSVTAVFANTSTAWFLAGGDHLYDDLNDAASYAATAGTKTVILLNSGTLAAGSYTIPSGVTLLVPFDTSNTLYTTQPASTGTTYTKPTIFRKLIMAEGAKITVNGAISLPAKYKSNSGEPSGPVSMIEMKAGSSITLESGGKLYAWGFITGAGEVVAKSGSIVYENMQFMDWRGGDQTTSIKNNVFPLSQYYIQNIEVPLTLHAGAKEYGFVSVTVTLLGEQKATPYLFGVSESTADKNPLFIISSGSLTKKYDGSKDRLVIEVNGTVSLGSLTLTMGRVYSVKSSEYVLPLNSNMSILVKSGGKVFVTGDIAFIPGTELTIDEGATVEFTGTDQRIYIYDSDTWGTYCGSDNKKFKPLQYAPGRTYNRKESDLKDVSVLINGTVDAGQAYIYTTSGGANIYSTGSGSITFGDPGTDTITYQVIQAKDPSNSTYVEIPITPAKLKNGNGTFVETSVYGSGTYKYIGGYWHLGEDHTYNWDSVLNDTETKYINHLCCDFCTDLLATVDLQYRLDDYIWMNAIVDLEKAGSITVSDDISLVAVSETQYYLVRKVVAKELTTAFTADLAINGIADPFTIQLGFSAFDATLPDNHVHKPLVAKMMAYGEAAKIYFTPSEKNDYNTTTTSAPVLSMGTGVDKAMSITAAPKTDDEGVTLKTNSAKVYFDEALRMSVFFTPDGLVESNVVKIGLLVSDGTLETTGVLTVANHKSMYVLYSLTTPEGSGGKDNYPTVHPGSGTPIVDYTTWPTENNKGRWELCFDLTNDMYGKAYEMRPFAILEDGSCVYGDQVHYSLAAYISRTYTNSTDKAFKNLLVATWDYIVAADAAF